jgi:hypothetical protein
MGLAPQCTSFKLQNTRPAGSKANIGQCVRCKALVNRPVVFNAWQERECTDAVVQLRAISD